LSKQDHFLQFPISALSYGPDPKTRLNEIVDYCVIEQGRNLAKTTLPEMTTAWIQQTTHGELPEDFNPAYETHRELFLGCRALGIQYRRIGSHQAAHDRVAKAVRSLEWIHGPSSLVRIKTDWIFKARDGAMSYRDFSILAALYCAIGNHKARIIRRSTLPALALGYKVKAFRADGPKLLGSRTDGAKPWTESQIKTTLEKLRMDGYFARVNANRRSTYYSIRMSEDDLRAFVKARALKRIKSTYDGPSKDRVMQAEVRAERERFTTPGTVKPTPELTPK